MGFTVSVKLCPVPVHPFAVGVTVIVAFPETLGENAEIFPDPDAPNPMAVFELLQLKVELATPLAELKVIELKL